MTDDAGLPLIDAHVHLGPSDTGELYYGRLLGDEFVRLCDEAGVAGALVFPPLLHAGYAQANIDLADWCERTGRGMRALARIGGKTIGVTEPQLWLVRKKLRGLVLGRKPDLDLNALPRFAGVKLLPHLDGLPGSEVFEEIARLDLPVLTHGGVYVDPGYIERAILPNIETKLVIAHLGAFPDGEANLRAAVDLAAREERVYLDTSGIWIADFLRYAVDRVPDKLIWGSDCPLTHPRVAWRFVTSVVTDDRLLAKIGYETAKEVYG